MTAIAHADPWKLFLKTLADTETVSSASQFPSEISGFSSSSVGLLHGNLLLKIVTNSFNTKSTSICGDHDDVHKNISWVGHSRSILNVSSTSFFVKLDAPAVKYVSLVAL